MTERRDLLSANEIIKLLTDELNLKLRANGKSIFFLCPFHKEKTPSFCFNPSYKIFKCFACQNFNDGKPGDIFTFWAAYKQITVEEAIKEISFLGFFSLEQINREKQEKKDELSNFFSLINNIYHYNLFTKPGNNVLRYLVKKRKIEKPTIERFQLGCTINDNQLSNLFFKKKEGEPTPSIAQCFTGLWQIDWKEQIRDFFPPYNVIIPLFNENKQMIAWASRKIALGEENKYLFLPGYNEYKKTDLIFNYFEVKQLNNEECFLVEGFFDVFSLTQKGIKNCLALLGINISSVQLNLLKKLKKRVVLFLDPDEAGKEASIKMIRDLTLFNIDCEIISPESYKDDPDKLCILKEKEDIECILKQRENPFLFILRYYYQKFLISDNPQRIETFLFHIHNLFKNCRLIYNFLVRQTISMFEKEEEKKKVTAWFSYSSNTPSLSHKFVLSSYCQKKLKEAEKKLLSLCVSHRKYWMLVYANNYYFKYEKKDFIEICNFYNSSFQKTSYIKSNNNLTDLEKNSNEGEEVNLNNVLTLLREIKETNTFKNNHEKN